MDRATIDIELRKGETFQWALRWTSGGTPALPTPVNLTGCTARMQIRRTPSATEVLASFTTENGRIALGGALGTIAVSMPATDTSLLAFRTGVYDLEVVFADGTVKNLVGGRASTLAEVTR